MAMNLALRSIKLRSAFRSPGILYMLHAFNKAMPPPRLSVMMLQFLLWTELVSTLAGQAFGQWTSTPFSPPAFPLAVRSPYLNVWLSQASPNNALSNFYPQFRSLSLVEWFAAVKVDGQTFRIMGTGGDNYTQATQLATEFTATRSSFLFRCSTVDVNATFLTPITPTDLTRQSMPFSYFYISAEANDQNNHNISVYSDIAGNLLSGVSSQLMDDITPDPTADNILLSMKLDSTLSFTGDGPSGNALDATAFYGIVPDMQGNEGVVYSWQISLDTSTRAAFSSSSILLNSSTSKTSESLATVNNTVLALAVDVGSVVATGNIVFAVGVARDPVVQLINQVGFIEEWHPYYLSSHSSLEDAMQFFMSDFGVNGISQSIESDMNLQSDASKISDEYADLIALTARQALSAMDITLSQNSDGSWDTSDVKAFVDNTDDIGTDPGVNVVDVLYATLPAYLYFNPQLVGYLLKPLLEYQDTFQYTLPYAAQRIGSAYPNATADSINDPHQYGVEESANMIIMTLAHAQRTGDGTLISQHYTLLRKWADYLVQNALFPSNQSSPDFTAQLNLTDVPTNNLTSIALKGILGIGAMSKISSYAGVKDDASNYASTAQQFVQQWQDLVVSSSSSQPHLLMVYGDQDSEALMYNLYVDKLLQLGATSNTALVPDSVYDTQTSFIASSLTSDFLGLPLDNNNITLVTIDDSPVYVSLTRSDWMMFAAAVATNDSTRDGVVHLLHNTSLTSHLGAPFCVGFEIQTGICAGGAASPAQGGLFALLAMNLPIKSSISLPTDGSTIPGLSSHKKSHVGAIVGGVIGGLAAIAVIVGVERYLRRRRRQRKRNVNYYNLEYIKGGRSPGIVKDRSSIVSDMKA